MNIDVKKYKHSLGSAYGAVGGLAFAVLAWGMDALLLSRAHATFSWVIFIPGALICAIAGGLAGYHTIRTESHRVAFILWLLVGLLFSWLVIWLPLSARPFFIEMLSPDLASWFDFSSVSDLYQFRLVSLVVCGLTALIAGLLEINLIKQAMFSPYRVITFTAMLVCVIIMGVAGSAMDHMINTNFREPVQAVNRLIQFAADNQGREVPVEEARAMHLSSVRDLDHLLDKPRQLTLVSYDPPLGQMDVLVDFGNALVKCTAIYAQPTQCVILADTP